MRILVDTNVYLDLLLNRDDKGIVAKDFFANCLKMKSQTFLTSISLRDIEYVVHKFTHDSTLSRKAALDAYCLCSKVIGITADDAINSIYSNVKDFEDSLLLEAAKREKLDLIVTNNVKDFEGYGFPVISPQKYNEIVKGTIQ